MNATSIAEMSIAQSPQPAAPNVPQQPALCCRFCGAALRHVFADLGTSPLCESYLSAEQLGAAELFYPLVVYVCESCLLVQVPMHVSGEHIFSEYAYFSSFSRSYLDHARRNVLALIERFAISSSSFVVELASNDGYLLRNFSERQIPCLGIEPAANVALAAQQQGVSTLVKFFGESTAGEVVLGHQQADLLIANNVLAHVPDLHDFAEGMKVLLAADGVAVVEVQHLLRLIQQNQFDTIYHEHFSYFTLGSLSTVLLSHGLTVFDVEELPTHGGSLRVYLRHSHSAGASEDKRIQQVLAQEQAAGLHNISGYGSFAEQISEVKRQLLEFLIGAKRGGKSIVGYGAPGKGNTLLNYCGIRQDFLDYTVDRNPYKQGKFLPGTRVPILAPEKISQTHPDFVLILPWNLRDEIAAQLVEVREWGGKFVVPIPRLEIW
jgi:hypothetical protein